MPYYKVVFNIISSSFKTPITFWFKEAHKSHFLLTDLQGRKRTSWAMVAALEGKYGGCVWWEYSSIHFQPRPQLWLVYARLQRRLHYELWN